MAAKPIVAHTFLSTHRSSRGGRKIDHIVLHYTTSRNIRGTIEHFLNGTPRVSAHYIVGQDGELVQMVPDDMAAWHAGSVDMNARSIGIEHAAADGDRLTPQQETTSAALIKWLASEYGVAPENIIPHAAVHTTSCPGHLFSAYGGKAGASAEVQGAAVRAWLAARVFAEPVPSMETPSMVDGPSAADAAVTGQTAATVAPTQPGPTPTVIMQAQAKLAAIGYAPGAADGIAGPRTAAAVSAFQTANALPATGQLDDATLAAIAAAPVPPPTDWAGIASTVANTAANVVAAVAPKSFLASLTLWGATASTVISIAAVTLSNLPLGAAIVTAGGAILAGAATFFGRFNAKQPLNLMGS
jgi:N-acetyl-anhydromuramyl-L-alanine amidase AmpD